MDAFTKEKERQALRNRIFELRPRLFEIANWRKKFIAENPSIKYSNLSNIANGLGLTEFVVEALEKFVENHERKITSYR